MKAQEQAEDTAYRVYVTDSLKLIVENTARYAGGQTLTKRFIDVLHPQKQDSRTGAEIAADVIQKAGLVVKPE